MVKETNILIIFTNLNKTGGMPDAALLKNKFLLFSEEMRENKSFCIFIYTNCPKRMNPFS